MAERRRGRGNGHRAPGWKRPVRPGLSIVSSAC